MVACYHANQVNYVMTLFSVLVESTLQPTALWLEAKSEPFLFQLFKLIFHQTLLLFFLSVSLVFDTIFIHDGLHVLSVSQQLIILTR